MIIYRLPKLRFVSTLIILFLTLQISACGTEEFLTAVAPDIGSSTGADISASDESKVTADVALSWVAPAEREDSTSISLSEIAGYKVYYGTTQDQYLNSVLINDGSAVGHIFNGFPAGTYYFTVTTLDTEGRESQYSTEVTIVI